MVEDYRKDRILIEATRIISETGYQNTEMANIAAAAGVTTSLIYSHNFFINKLDLLLSIVLNFWLSLNNQVDERIGTDTNPCERMDQILNICNEMLIDKDGGIYLAKVLHEPLPHLNTIKDNELIEKRKQISTEHKKILNILDATIKDGQKKGIFDNTLTPSILRKTLYGAFGFLLYDAFFNVSGKEKDDILKVMKKLLEKFLLTRYHHHLIMHPMRFWGA